MRGARPLLVMLLVVFALIPARLSATTTPQFTDPNIVPQKTTLLRAATFAAPLNLVPASTTETTVVLTPENAKDIWTTSRYAYDGVSTGPGGGLDNERLIVGGWGDSYYSLLRFNLAGLPANVTSARLELYSAVQRGIANTAMYLDRVTSAWDWWSSGTGRDKNRLWWADRPTAVQVATLSVPAVNSWYSIDVTDLYRKWQDGTNPNFGIQFRPKQTSVNTWDEFYSTDYTGTEDLRPRLILTTEQRCVSECNSSVLFIPGLEASRIYGPDPSGSEEKYWEPWGDGEALELEMNGDGSPKRDDLYTRDVVDNAYLPVKGNIYKSFLEQLAAMKTGDEIADYGVVPYDWRLSLDQVLQNGARTSDGRIYYAGPLAATSTPYIVQELRRLAQGSRTGKVTIIAHSNGGLVAKALTNALGAEAPELIDKMVFVAVPSAGAPKAVGALLHGYDQGLPVDELALAMSPTAARALASNMPGVYNLLPSSDYFTYVDDPIITISDDPLLVPWRAAYGAGIHSGEMLRQFVADSFRALLPVSDPLVAPPIGNSALLGRAEALHAALDSWIPPAGITLTEIAGWGEETLSTIAYSEGLAATCTAYSANSTCTALTTRPVLEYTPVTTLDGDGTVTVPSALWTPSSSSVQKYWVNLRGYSAQGLYEALLNRKHASILEIPQLLTFIQKEVTNTASDSLPKFISTSTPIAIQEKRFHFILHSPLSLDLFDDLGNHTGISTTTNSLEENIPGSYYERFGEVQYVSVPATATVHLAMKGQGEGSFTLDVAEVQGSQTLASTTFAAVPASLATNASLTVPSTGLADASPLFVDENNDGKVDLKLVPKPGEAVVPDLTPPEAVFAFSPEIRDIALSPRDQSSVAVSGRYTLTDSAGNTTVLAVKKRGEEEKEKRRAEKKDRDGEVKLSLVSASYSNQMATSIFPKNSLSYSWESDKKGNLVKLEQRIELHKESAVRALYDAKKNTTKIYVQEVGEEREDKGVLKTTKPGLVILKLVTSRGQLGIEY